LLRPSQRRSGGYLIDEKDHLGDKIHVAEMAHENQWARQSNEEILARLRRKYIKAMHCPHFD